ncbi:NmrA family NAD(P)-binding protein [Sphingomonas abietis]|uniref:NAD(P)H-binding protein n=1 Tax=Sphingomonas abietis TaxID=3012344 RepID=A0ABY7NQI5_9SPHN|nr:NAD(P)H-binding protein [Sphingomonas abietis]WBO23800.1 NAD(P)H-binding protein [Sphingomonas abietis]
MFTKSFTASSHSASCSLIALLTTYILYRTVYIVVAGDCVMIVVTAPTGNIGRQLLDHLVNGDEPVRVIARDPARLPENIRESVDVIVGSHGDAEVVSEAFDGADSVFWLVPPDPKAASLDEAYSGFSRPACDAFVAQGVKRVVSISALGRGTSVAGRAGHVTASLAMDDLIASTGVAFRALTMPSFMDNLLGQAGAIKERGMFFSPMVPDRKFPTCATADIAAAAANLLLDHGWTGQGHIAVLGPEDLSFDEMAVILSETIGRSVAFQQIPMDAFAQRIAGFGMSEVIVQGYVDMMTAKNEGLDNAEPRTAGATSPTSFRTWCETILKPAILG